MSLLGFAALLGVGVVDAVADAGAQCTASLGTDGKLHSKADAGQVADACLAAAASDNDKALYLAGLIMERGIGKPRNLDLADKWYRKAARKGDVEAQYALGRVAEARSRDGEALNWYGRAALRNHAAALAAWLRLKVEDPDAMWDAAIEAIFTDPGLGSQAEFARSGSGIVIADMLVLTNEHVVEGCDQMAIAPGLPARVVARDADLDLAVLRTTMRVGAVAGFAPGNKIERGQPLFTGGYPGIGDAAPTFVMTTGKLSDRKYGDAAADYWLLTNDINPGNSGGPLLDASGRVVGVVTAKIPVTGIVKKNAPAGMKDGIAIRPDVIRGFLDGHKIGYRTLTQGPLADTAGMENHAAAISVLVQCFQK